MIDRIEAPIPWLEIAVDEAIMAIGLGHHVPDSVLSTSLPVELSWDDKVAFAQKVGLDALGIYHWEAFGSLEDDSQPVISRIPKIERRQDLDLLEIPPVSAADLKTEVDRAKEAIGDSGIALFVEFSSCFEFAVADIGLENLCIQLVDDPLFVEEVLARYAAYTTEMVRIYNSFPEIDFLWIGDDLAYKTGPFISPVMLRKYVFPHIQSVVQKIQKPWFFHSDGDLSSIIDDILIWKPQAIHPIEGDAGKLISTKRDYGNRVALIGNLSVDLLSRGTPSEVALRARQLIDSASPGGGYGFSSGNALTRFMPFENIMAVSDVINEINDR